MWRKDIGCTGERDMKLRDGHQLFVQQTETQDRMNRWWEKRIFFCTGNKDLRCLAYLFRISCEERRKEAGSLASVKVAKTRRTLCTGSETKILLFIHSSTHIQENFPHFSRKSLWKYMKVPQKFSSMKAEGHYKYWSWASFNRNAMIQRRWE